MVLSLRLLASRHSLSRVPSPSLLPVLTPGRASPWVGKSGIINGSGLRTGIGIQTRSKSFVEIIRGRVGCTSRGLHGFLDTMIHSPEMVESSRDHLQVRQSPVIVSESLLHKLWVPGHVQ